MHCESKTSPYRTISHKHNPMFNILQAQSIRKNSTIPNHGAKSNQVGNGADTVQDSKLLVERLHLLAMGPIVVALLAIPSFLVLPDAHDLGCLGSNVHQVGQRSDKHGGVQPGSELVGGRGGSGGREEGKGRRRVGGRGRLEERGEKRSSAAAGIGQQHCDGESSLQGEVDGEGVFLQLGELGAGQDSEGDNARDEGLEERGAEKSAIAACCVNMNATGWW